MQQTIIEEVVRAFDFRKEVTGEDETGLVGRFTYSFGNTPIVMVPLYQVILLHGPSGTGKTATVEAIAEHLRRPLYSLQTDTLPLDATLLWDTLISRLDVCSTRPL